MEKSLDRKNVVWGATAAVVALSAAAYFGPQRSATQEAIKAELSDEEEGEAESNALAKLIEQGDVTAAQMAEKVIRDTCDAEIARCEAEFIPYLLEETTRCVILHNYDVVDPNCTLLAAEAEEEANLIDLK
ncbi:hypothetical protein KBD59_04520, partial [Candidatus Gracilibacteria bacterium]|nr:hypothetical protein [Candidatus Gracilibacteria bacterium]